MDLAGGCDKSVKRSRLSRRMARIINPLIQSRPLVPLHLGRWSFEEGGGSSFAFKMLGKDKAEGQRSLQFTPHSSCPIKRHMDSGAGTWHAQENAGQILQPRRVSFSRTWSSVCSFQGFWCPNCESATPTVSGLSRHGRPAAMNRPQPRRSRRGCPGSVSIYNPRHDVSLSGSNCPRLVATVSSTTSSQPGSSLLVES